jgi:hypothetical protein
LEDTLQETFPDDADDFIKSEKKWEEEMFA